jgi:transglutaminase-like putative cysteine protease
VKLRLSVFGPLSAFFCEFIGLAALALTPEVERWPFAVPIGIAVVAWPLRARLPDRFLLPAVAILVLAGYATASGAPTGTLVARAMIPTHALLWLAADERVYRFWRLGVALVELVLAAILSPEAHMFVLIFLFVLVSSLALSLGFLERRFHERDPEALRRPLRPGFVGSVLALSCVMFLSSLLIFPILPRSRWNGAGNETNAGYSDVVSFQQGILRWARQDTRPALWIFRNGSTPWEKILPYYLLRGQGLGDFNGQEWRTLVTKAAIPPLQVTRRDGEVDILRQPLPADILPVPYFATSVNAQTPDYPVLPVKAGEWAAQGSRGHSVRYHADYGVVKAELARPSAPALSAFDGKMFPKLGKLARELTAGAANDDDRVNRIMNFFRDGGFAYELRSVNAYRPGHVHPLEEFVFDNRKGHCELFASAAAMLFRAAGLPARLVVGFRVRPPSRGDVLTVRSSDAHAWVEVWRKGRGWTPADPTPVLSEPGWFGETLGELNDLIGAYWHRYILEYEFDADSLADILRTVFGIGSVLILLAGATLWWRRRTRLGPNNRERLMRVMLRLEDDLIHRAGVFPDQAYRDVPEAREWRRRYTELRFGRREPTAGDLGGMRRSADRIILACTERARGAPAPRSAG